MAEVLLETVSKVYPNGVEAVKRLTLRVGDGEFFVLLGPSGCGKTTTLRLLAGLEEPTAGEVILGGRPVTRLPPHRRDVAMLFQTPVLYPHLRVRDNLVFGCPDPYNWIRPWAGRRKHADRAGRLDEAVRLLRLEPLLERWPAELSGGERQRVALGRALLRRPAVFLLDEPLTHLDASLRGAMRQELKELQRRLNATMLAVTHDQGEALALGDRVAVLRAGELQQVGPPEAVYAAPANLFVAAFIGQPPMNLLCGELVSREGGTAFRAARSLVPVPDGFAPPAAGKPLVLGVRPDDVAIGAAGMDGRVEADEFLGESRIVTVSVEDCRLVARVGSSQRVPVGARVRVAWNWSHIHWFDGTTGTRLAAAGGRPVG
jgi:ABC-type sugar transport system ATPase subunit